jgi:hypothetical protein
MRIALHTPIAAGRKEPLVEMLGRIRRAFLDAGLGEPTIRFTMTDMPGPNGVSAIDRVLKRYPDMNRFLSDRQLAGGLMGARMLSNALSGEPVDLATLESIAAGVPRSFPFHALGLHLHAPAFGERLIGLPALGHSYPGILIGDNWWVSGRQRSLSAYTVVEADQSARKLPPTPPAIDAVIKACGKPKKTVQVPILAPGGGLSLSVPQANLEAVKAVNADYRARMTEIVTAAAMPHNLPPTVEALQSNLGVLAGPRKPALEAAFKPMGYSCSGGSGEFHLKRRTSANLTVELSLDVGTWSHMVTASFVVHGAGFRASLGVPIAPGIFGQYPIGDASQWQKIVENLAAIVSELDRTFVPAIEQGAGPSPAWYEPPS